MRKTIKSFMKCEIWVLMLGVFLLSSISGSQVKAAWEELSGTIYYTGGNVGIGTSTPGAKLEIYDGDLHINKVSGTSILRFQQAGDNKWGILQNYGSPDGIGFYSYKSILPGLKMEITKDGNIGIGTMSPGAKLEVIGGSSQFGLIVEGDGVAANARIALRRANSTSATGNLDWIGNTNTVGARIGVNDDVGGSMAFKLGGNTLSDTKMIISSSGNVGIGTTGPGAKLHIMSNGGQLWLQNNNATASIADIKLLGGISTTLYNWQIGKDITQNDVLQFIPSTVAGGQTFLTAAMTIARTGYVGIGTSNPGAKLEIYDGDLHINKVSGTSVLRFQQAGDNKWGILQNYGSVDGIGFYSYKSISPGLKMEITKDGNVGIGTMSPGAKLEVIGGSNQFGLIVEGDGVASNARIALRRSNSISATGNLDWIGNTNAVGARIGVNDDVGGSMAFKLGGNALSDTKMIITSNGSVGIGTTAPQSELAVKGTITAKEVIVTTTGWSDFVFNDDYKLMKLNDLEQNIKGNGHLPNIPSASEVAENGVSVGEMQAKLLQKVEELTLYMIEQNKEINMLKKELAAVKQEK